MAVSKQDLALAVMFAVLTGISFSLNSLNLKFYLEELKFPPDQMTQDANLVFATIIFPFWVYEQATNPGFTLEANFKGALIAWMFTFALISVTIAFDLGKAGNVQAIENLKIIVQTLMVVFIDGLIPNTFEVCGLALSILGVLLIVLSR